MKGNYRKGKILLDEYDDQHLGAEDEETAMFHRLMRAFLRYRVGDGKNSVVETDSLCRYYEQFPRREERVLAYLIMADANRIIREYPVAMHYCLNAENAAKEMGKDNLLCWIYRQKGIIYKSQGLYDEAQGCFRKHYALAEKLNDSRQIIMGLHDMGFVYTYKGDADSTIYSYKKSIALAECRNDSDLFLPLTRSRLYDIYIQLGQYDSVKNVMPRDSMNLENWGYYYTGVGNVDSAVYYFQKSLGNFDVMADRRCLKELIRLEKARGHLKQVVALYEQLEMTDDSIRRIDQTMETRRTEARYNYERMKQQRDELEKQEEKRNLAMMVMVFVTIFCLLAGLYFLNGRKAEKRIERVQQELRRREEEDRRSFSDEQASRLKTFQESLLYKKIRYYAGDKDFRLTDDEWLELSDALDAVYDNMTGRLLNMADLTPTELRVVYLLKMEVKPADIANILCKSKSGITMIRRRMFEKICGYRGTAGDLDTYIRNFF